MKKKFIGLFSLVMAVCIANSMLSHSGPLQDATKTDLSRLHVRVNGYEVEFTDAQPYIDENNRTMIPLRACVEALGAEVTWDQNTYTASITKNGTTVKVTIDSKELVVVNDGLVSYETMDTMAVLNTEEGRTYVPIRYVAEALGAYVDYSAAFRTIGIYQDVLSPEEIETLHQYELTYGKEAYTYEERVEKKGQADADEHFPYRKEQMDSFSNARECLYDSFAEAPTKYWAENLNQYISCKDEDAFFDLLVKETVAELSYVAEHEVMYQRAHIEFRADASSIYAITNGDSVYINLRGYLLYYDNKLDTWENPEKYGIDYQGIHKADYELMSGKWNNLRKFIKEGKACIDRRNAGEKYIPLDLLNLNLNNGTMLVPIDVTIRLDQLAPQEYQIYATSLVALDDPVILEGDRSWQDFWD